MNGFPYRCVGPPTAKQGLRDREGLTGKGWQANIGSWQRGEDAPVNIPDLPKWAEAHGVDAVVWTALCPQFGHEKVSPPVGRVITYLQGLTGTVRDEAKQYIERAPRQIDTEYRRNIEAALGWRYQER